MSKIKNKHEPELPINLIIKAAKIKLQDAHTKVYNLHKQIDELYNDLRLARQYVQKAESQVTEANIKKRDLEDDASRCHHKNLSSPVDAVYGTVRVVEVTCLDCGGKDHRTPDAATSQYNKEVAIADLLDNFSAVYMPTD